MRVEAGKVAEFARAVGDDRPHAADRPAPVTFLATAFHWSRPFDALMDALGTDADHALHGRQRYAFCRPLRAGDELSAEVRHAATYEKTGRRGGALRFHVLRTAFTDDSAAPVAVAEATVVHTSVPFSVQASTSPPAADPAPASGIGPGAWAWGPITLTDIVRYAGASGDFTALHHDPEVAARLGLHRVFAMGMLTAGVLGRYATARLGDGAIAALDLRFHDKTWLGDTVVCTSEDAASGAGRTGPDATTHAFTARDQTGRLLVSAVAATVADLPPS
jgi:acyl dehydratase